MDHRHDHDSNSSVRVALAGLGRSGWGIHASAIDTLSDRFEVAAVFDLDADRVAEATERFGCRAVGSFEELIALDDVDLVVVATPNRFHTEHAIAAMEAGKHVVCEKPFAGDTDEADRAIAAAERTGRVLAPFQNKRYAPDFEQVKKVIDSGKLGRIVQIRMALQGFSRRWDWQTLRELGGGQLNNTGPHLIDQALQLLGPAEPEVFCQLDRALASGDADDHVKILLRAEDAPLLDIEITRACPYSQDNWLVMGTSGGLRGGARHLDWKYVDFDAMPDRPVDRTPTADRSYNREELDWTEETWDCPEETKVGRYPAQRFYKDLYRTLREDAPLVITPASVRRQIDIIERCHAMNQTSLAPTA